MLRGRLPTSSEILSTEYRPSCQKNNRISKSLFFGPESLTRRITISLEQKDVVSRCIAGPLQVVSSSKNGRGVSMAHVRQVFSKGEKEESDGSSRSKVGSAFNSSCLELQLNPRQLGYSSSSCDSRELAALEYSTERSLSNLWKRICGKRRTRSLAILNFLAALYGSCTVADKFAADAAPALPASLSSTVRFCSALVVFLPELMNVIKNLDVPALKAGAELGGLLFAATILETLGNGDVSSDAPLLFAFTVIFVPLMELFSGRQSVRRTTRFASLVALSGMGFLEEEGFGWRGISLPQIESLSGLVASAIYGLHIFRAQGHSSRVDPVSLTAVQCGTLAVLSVWWEACSLSFNPKTSYCMQYLTHLESLPWCPLVYSGLVCAGLCSWLELRGLRSVPGSTATMINTTIPIWGAFFSFLLRGDVPGESAVLGGSVILCASIFAQIATKQDDTILNAPKLKCKLQALNRSDLTTSKASDLSPATDQRHQELQQVDTSPKSAYDLSTPADHVQGAIISSQLKFPYYAAQVKKLMAELKIKVMSAKSAVASLKVFAAGTTVTSSSLVSNAPQTTGATAAHASTTGASSAITSAAGTVHQAVNNVVVVAGTTTTSATTASPTDQAPLLQGAISNLAQLTHATTYIQSAPQWVDSTVVKLASSLATLIVTTTTGLENTAMAVESDVIQAVDEVAEDFVNVANHLLQQIAENSMAAASSANMAIFQTLQGTTSNLASHLHVELEHLAFLAAQTGLDRLLSSLHLLVR